MMRVSKIQHELSYVPIHITMRFENTDLAIATAFFYAFDDKDFLITNWHNVTGRKTARSLSFVRPSNPPPQEDFK